MAITVINGKRGTRYRIDYRDADGKRRYETCASRHEAKQLEAERLRERSGNPHEKFATIAERWFRLASARVRPQSLETYRRALDLHILPTLAEKRVSKIRPTEIELMLSEKLASGLSAKTVGHVQSVLYGVLKLATKDRLIGYNPATGIAKELGLRRLSPSNGKVKAFTAEELSDFLDAAKQISGRLYPLFFTMARTGLRISEALALTWDDIDLEGRVDRGTRIYQITVSKSMRRDGAAGATKNDRVRRVDMSAALREVLQEHRRRWLEESLASGSREPLAFQREPGWRGHGRHWRTNKVQSAFKLAASRAGLPLHFSLHTLRHTFASIHIQLGTPIAYLQQQLGHASISMTIDIYGHWLSKTNQQAADMLDTAGVADRDLFVAKKP